MACCAPSEVKVGIFGGSFNPVHEGHLWVIEQSLQRVDRVIVVPAWLNPLKEQSDYMTPRERLRTVREAVSKLPSKLRERVEVSDWEIVEGERALDEGRADFANYTIDTLRHFRAEYLDAELFLVMGQDAFDSFDRWKDTDTIRNLAELLVFPRVLNISSSGIRSSIDNSAPDSV